jgi:hypothetical protein
MGTSHGDFTKYPRTPHFFGSKGTDDDKHLGESESKKFISDGSLIIEEKLDGTNVGIHFSDAREMVLQCRGHLITEGMHPQYDLFKQWAAVKRHDLESQLQNRFILFGEWVYLRTEADGIVTGRAKFVRPEFVEKIKQSTHWQHQQMVPNLLAEDVDIWG